MFSIYTQLHVDQHAAEFESHRSWPIAWRDCSKTHDFVHFTEFCWNWRIFLLRFGKNQYILGGGDLEVAGVQQVKLGKAKLPLGCCRDNVACCLEKVRFSHQISTPVFSYRFCLSSQLINRTTVLVFSQVYCVYTLGFCDKISPASLQE